MNIDELQTFIVTAKQRTYVGDALPQDPSAPGSHDIVFSQGDWSYLDRYFGGTNFLGQETVWFRDVPVWSMAYFGVITRPELIDGQRAGETIVAALSSMYDEGRFLGGFSFSGEHGTYVDASEGTVGRFTGREYIEVGGVQAYELSYFGGLVFE
ncbi:DUF5680 domain-containing protein [Timonella sp. A28]|uniref:DUF5680 domain-containing protein n=1 Tax=Timonella sp. A28 TaxID=3442640 RepID=UPI003EBB18D1